MLDDFENIKYDLNSNIEIHKFKKLSCCCI